MSAIAIVVAAAAAIVAGLCAASDGALLALDPDDRTLEHELATLRDRRERTHRALAFARVVAHLTTGAALAVALRLATRSAGEALLLSRRAGRDVKQHSRDAGPPGVLLHARAA